MDVWMSKRLRSRCLRQSTETIQGGGVSAMWKGIQQDVRMLQPRWGKKMTSGRMLKNQLRWGIVGSSYIHTYTYCESFLEIRFPGTSL